MSARALLQALRSGDPVSPSQVTAFAEGIASGDVSDAQVGAFAMAVCWRGLSPPARVALTTAMRDGGQVMEWQLDGPVVDKHSTGGIGDCVSLVLAPALAACGAYVPMISGRGLGHTGGTLDKLEAIPGLTTKLETRQLRRQTAEIGCAIAGASGEIAPADARLYAARDVTGTVKSIDLIVASILSKKLAAGLGALVLDVKTGSGAIMQDPDEAEDLAHALVATAKGAGCPTAALVTDMGEPLARSMGNALEVAEAVRCLTDGGEDELGEVTMELGGTALALAGLVEDPDEGAEAIRRAIEDGRAAEVFGRMVAAQGGPSDFLSRWADRLPGAPVTREVRAGRSGTIAAMDGRALGEVVVSLGGGRRSPGDRIDPSVGLSEIAEIGRPVDPASVLAIVHAATEDEADRAARAVRGAMTVGQGRVTAPPLIRSRID